MFNWAEDHTDEEWAALAAEERAASTRSWDERNASWERSDTDGFLSQWASEQMASRHSAAASLADDHGIGTEVVLTRDGQPVPSKMIEGTYGYSWAELESWEFGAKVVAWVGVSNAKSAARRTAYYAAKGYAEAEVTRRLGVSNKSYEIYALPIAPLEVITPNWNDGEHGADSVFYRETVEVG